jgi:hypothetical protein
MSQPTARLAQRHWEEPWLELSATEMVWVRLPSREVKFPLGVFVANHLSSTGAGLGLVGERFAASDIPFCFFSFLFCLMFERVHFPYPILLTQPGTKGKQTTVTTSIYRNSYQIPYPPP